MNLFFFNLEFVICLFLFLFSRNKNLNWINETLHESLMRQTCADKKKRKKTPYMI